MDAKEIRELIEIISRSNFSTFELEREGFKLKLVKAGTGAAPVVVPASGDDATAELPAPRAPEAAPAIAEAAEPGGANGSIVVTSPIVGTFYRSPNPDASPFVELGSKVKKGQVLCIVEAMKLMNEIESEVEGEVVEISVANGQPVEYGEVLFRLKALA